MFAKIKLPRIYIHIPVGWLNVGLICVGAVLGGPWLAALITISVMIAVGFIIYELNQGGDPFRDIKSYIWGLGTGGVTAAMLALAGVI